MSGNSRITPSQQYPVFTGESRASQEPQRVNYVLSGNSGPNTKMFYSHNGVKVNPIESKYVPIAQYQSTQQHLTPNYHPPSHQRF